MPEYALCIQEKYRMNIMILYEYIIPNLMLITFAESMTQGSSKIFEVKVQQF